MIFWISFNFSNWVWPQNPLEKRPISNKVNFYCLYVCQNDGFLVFFPERPKYSNEGLKKVLQDYCGDMTLENLREESKKLHPNSNPKARLLILAYSTTQRYTNFFLSPLVDKNPWYKNAKVWEFCLNYASAPTFFPPYKFNLVQDSLPDIGTDCPV